MWGLLSDIFMYACARSRYRGRQFVTTSVPENNTHRSYTANHGQCLMALLAPECSYSANLYRFVTGCHLGPLAGSVGADRRPRPRLTAVYAPLPSAIGRTLIPRYFRSIFEGGVTELYFSLRHPKESFHNTSITLDCDQACMVTHHGKPMIAKVSPDCVI